MSGDASAAIGALSFQPMTIEAAVGGGVPDQPGLYALHGSSATWAQLGLGPPPDERPLYVGKAEASLVSRDLRTHFATGRTGQSSPRRSFAALLAREAVLALVAMPRRPANPEPRKWTHFALEPAGDEALTNWMRSQLRIAVWLKPGGARLADLENDVIRALRPPLNLTGVRTPWTDEVKAARATLAAAAKEWRDPEGFAV